MADLFGTDNETQDEVPSYLLGADAHNLGNQGNSWFDPTTWGDRLERGFQFGAASVVSGASQLYNTGVTIGNWAGAGLEEMDTKEVLTSLDADLGAYYDQNRTSADLVGFIASSFIPGIGGIKVLNAGQAALKGAIETGKIGGNLARATGLLVPKTEIFIQQAANDINAANATFSAINQAGIKALASGVVQNTLEAVAFETAVQATMFKSPILEEQDGMDIIKNIAIGGAVGGVIGGAFAGFSIKGQINKLVSKFETEGKFLSGRGLQQEMNDPAMRVILNSDELENAAQPLRAPLADTDEARATLRVDTQNYTDKVTRIKNESREQIHALTTGGDGELANTVADTLTGMSAKDTMAALLHTEQIARIGVKTKVESELAELAKKSLPDDPSLQVSYVRLIGEGAGEVLDSEPVVKSIADTIARKSGQSLEDAVLTKVRDYGFKQGRLWDITSKAGSKGMQETEARYIWADKVLKEIPDEAAIHQADIPVLERAWKDGQLNIKLVDNSGEVIKDGFASREELWRHLVDTKEDAAWKLLQDAPASATSDADIFGTEAVAKMVNTRLSRLDGTGVGEEFKDYLAHQTATESHKEVLRAKGLPVPDSLDSRMMPKYAKVSRRVEATVDLNGNVIDGITWIKQQGRKAQMEMDNVVAKAVGSIAEQIPEIPEGLLMGATRKGAGASLAGFANGGYGSLESAVQALGGITQKIKQQFRQVTSDTFQGPLAGLGRNQEAAIEFSTINQKVTRSAKQWVMAPAEEFTSPALVQKEWLDKILSGKGNLTFEDIPEEALIHIKTIEAHDAVNALIARSAARTQTYKELRAAQGLEDNKSVEVFRPIRPNPKDYPHFAFVKDDKVTGQGHTTMIFAKDAATLKHMADKAEASGYRVHYKSDTEDFHKAYGDYEYARTLNESYIDTDLKNKGIYSEFFTKTDPQKIVNDILQQHLREDDVLAMEIMRAKNQKAFDFLEDQGKAYSRVESSTLGGASIARIEKAGKNPYLDYIKTALDISKVSEHPLIYAFNKFLDDAVSKAVGHIGETFSKAKTTAELDQINSLLDKYGMNTGYRDAATDLLANHTAPKGELTKFIRVANALLSKLTLGLDPLNAVNNAIGANILRGTELKFLTDAIKSGDTELAGKLAELGKVALPEVGDQILAPTKLVARAIKNFFDDTTTGALRTRYQQAGYIKDITEQFHQIMDDFTLKGTETVTDLNSRLQRAFVKAKTLSETGEKFTGNKLAEEFNRFISADVMRQITDLGIEKNLLTPAEAHSYINTFVNRVEGNTIASQRPLMFQGPIGQAIGLFQSYQFNLMQQLFRYSAEGKAKDTAMLLGLQGTFYGLQGLPAFQFINQHVVGTLSGNKNHVDMYDATYGAAGKQMGDLLLYGLPSNILQSNLYSRGDINPRQVTVIPTALPEVPFIGGFGKLLTSMKETVQKIGMGGNVWESILQGIEHNGVSRPLAGLAQTMQAFGPGGQAYSTTNKGSILYSNDLFSVATATRLAGGRPLAEAIVNDGVFRVNAYNQMDQKRMNLLAESIRTTTIQGNAPDDESIVKFAQAYAEAGGKQQNFNRFMLNQMKTSNTPQAQKIITQLQNPFTQKIQLLMGGESVYSP